MAFTKNTTPTALAGILVTSTSLDSTPNNNVTGNSSGNIYQVRIDNSSNPNTAAYVKIADAASAAPASTAPHWVFAVQGGQSITYIMDVGVPYSVGVSVWCTTTPGTGAQGNVSNPLTLAILAT